MGLGFPWEMLYSRHVQFALGFVTLLPNQGYDVYTVPIATA